MITDEEIWEFGLLSLDVARYHDSLLDYIDCYYLHYYFYLSDKMLLRIIGILTIFR